MFRSDGFIITIEKTAHEDISSEECNAPLCCVWCKIVRTFHQRNVARLCVVFSIVTDHACCCIYVYMMYGGYDQEDCEDIDVYSGDQIMPALVWSDRWTTTFIHGEKMLITKFSNPNS